MRPVPVRDRLRDVRADQEAVLADLVIDQMVQNVLPFGGLRIVKAALAVDLDQPFAEPADQADVLVRVPRLGRVFGRPHDRNVVFAVGLLLENVPVNVE